MVLDVGLTQRWAFRSSTCVGDFLTICVHTPALTDAGVTLGGLKGTVLVTLWDELINDWSRAEEGEEARGFGFETLSVVSLALTLSLLSL